jgi:hypothetical protein
VVCVVWDTIERKPPHNTHIHTIPSHCRTVLCGSNLCGVDPHGAGALAVHFFLSLSRTPFFSSLNFRGVLCITRQAGVVVVLALRGAHRGWPVLTGRLR